MRLRINIVTVSILLLSSLANSQSLPSFQINDSNYLDIQFGIELGSKGLKNDFLMDFYQGQNLNESKVDALDGLRRFNHFGSVITAGIETGFKTKNAFLNKHGLGLVLSTGALNIQSVNYSKDAFKLFFFGNNADDQKEFYLKNERYFNFGQQRIGIGVFSRSKNFKAVLNAVGITNFSEVRLSNGYLNNQEEQLQIELNGTAVRTYGASYFKGIGLSGDLTYSIPLMIKENLSSIQISISNLGLGVVDKNLIQNTIDTSFTYSGLTFKEIFDYDSNGFRLEEQIGLHSDSNHREVMMLPMFIEVAKTINPDLDSKVQSFFGIRQYTGWNAFPLVYGGLIYSLNNHLFGGVNTSLGNFSKVRVGLNIGYLGQKFNVLLGADDLTSVGPNGNGGTLNIRTQWIF